MLVVVEWNEKHKTEVEVDHLEYAPEKALAHATAYRHETLTTIWGMDCRQVTKPQSEPE